MRSIALGAAALVFFGACADESGSASAGGSAAAGGAAPSDVPSFAAPWQVLAVGDIVTDGPPQGSFQSALHGFNYVFSGDVDPTYLCQHDDAGTAAKLDEGKLPDAIECAAYSAPSSPLAGNAPGAVAPPPGFSDWKGVDQGGGCGPWAVMMCNRILGLTDPTTPPTQDEYDAVSVALGTGADGGSRNIDLMGYYRVKGYCVGYSRFDGSAGDYASASAALADGCDLKLFYARRERDETTGAKSYSNSHVETVIAADADSITTNSWGSAGTVRGGSAGGFSHSEDGKRYEDNRGRAGPKWPPGDTEVQLVTVCPCSSPAFELLGQKVLSP